MVKLFVFASLLAATTTSMAGEKVIVVLKSKSAYEYEKTQIQRKSDLLTKGVLTLGLDDKNSITSVAADVDSQLNQLNAVILDLDNSADIETLKSLSHVAYVEKEVVHPLPSFKGVVYRPNYYSPMATVSTAANFQETARTPWGIKSVKAMEAWNVSNRGASARVMVLDTGIDKDHPSLKENIEAMKDFVGDNNKPYPAWDQVGHGTHCAGTIAGMVDETGFTGVAPSAKILMGRVCSTQGCSNLAVAKGINWGIEQKVDVISMSLGGSFSTPSERNAVAQALKAGVTVVAASGNDGSNKVGYPAALPGVIAVGAMDVNETKADFSQYGPELSVVAPGVAVNSSVPQGTGRESKVELTINGQKKVVNSTTFEGTRDLSSGMTGELVDAGLGKPEEFAKVNVAGKIALVKRGEIKFMDKIQNALNAKAAGILIYNNQPGLLNGSLSADGSIIDIGLAMIEQAEGEALAKQLISGTKAAVLMQTVATNYSNFDGTSMATPHVAGVVALIKATNKALTPKQVKELLMKTAKALGPNTNNELGAGLVNAEAAVNAALLIK